MELELNIEDSYAVHPMIIRNKTRDAAENIIQSLDGLSSLTEWDKIRRIEIIIGSLVNSNMLNEMQHSHINNNNRIRSELLGKTLNRIMANVKSYGEADEDYIREQMDIIRELYHIETNKD